MLKKQARVGIRLRRFREERGLTQAALAQALGISTSYVNQMESNQRALTVPVLMRLAETFDVDVRQFSNEEADRLTAELRDVFADPAFGEAVSLAETRELANGMPAVAHYILDLHRRYQHVSEINTSIATRLHAGDAVTEAGLIAPTAYEEVRDLFYRHQNHFDELDRAAEGIVDESGLVAGDMEAGLAERLRSRHGVTITDLDEVPDVKRRYDEHTRTLSLSTLLASGQRAFQLATMLAFFELGEMLDRHVDAASLSSDEARSLARIGLANYVAGAMILPYAEFRRSAEALRYDIDLLQRRFRVGFETVAHRLSTLQRTEDRGVPFFFIRVDRAGNISKRQSATDFHFSRVGGTCPLWNVYEAFSYPGQIRRQVAQMPDGRGYLWIARTVVRRIGGYGTPVTTFAIGLGCDLHHADRLVYADGIDLANPAARTPIGPGCKVCDRTGCPQRAFPAIGRPLDVDRNRSGFIPYRFLTEANDGA